ncbi:hypothetical protein KUTeg_012098 [Tegillarca granosa]|uniref:VWFA domain-containing protein n=1 Tax=Tegillarca granosa TaxID=220873 RepID=A0ABQ9EYK5_TEGGR|nr:hypothetical protein KUTeg_012098 [Tegillarca granosa]
MRHLRWIMQKDALGQDVFLIGSPGPLRRELAMMYMQLTKREGEYVSLSRDTTETDLKQRREIRSGTAYYIDQCAVRAALEGRILVLEGIEKAERNVLPILNNLLENREMQLDDGRFLVAADRYDKLLQDHSKEELDALKLVRVDERFRVIALGHPVPRYRGNPLDPPLRSRFQSRDVSLPPFKEQVEELQEMFRTVPSHKLSQMLSFANAMLTTESTSIGLPDFPIGNIKDALKILNEVPYVPLHSLVNRLYPYEVMLGKEGQNAVIGMLSKFELLDMKNNKELKISSAKRSDDGMAKVSLNEGVQCAVPAGVLPLDTNVPTDLFVATSYHNSFMAELLQSHLVRDMCIIGPRGCGKSAMIQHFAAILGYHIEPIMLYQDMTSRDLLQQRITLPNGDTTWRLSPLVTAAIEGSLAILDGVHRINQGSFAVLHRLIHDRELQLFDGSRLLRQDRYDDIKHQTGLSDTELGDRKIYPIHPSFRIVALAEPPLPGSSTQQWLTPELLTMFLFHNLRPLSQAEEKLVITTVVKDCPDITKLLKFVHQLRSSKDTAMTSISSSLSTRQLIRIAKRMAEFPTKDLYSIVQKACLGRFLPRLPKISLDQMLERGDINPVKKLDATGQEQKDHAITCEVKNGHVRIGETTVPVYNPENRTKVPDVLFYENPQHLNVMEDMLKDFTLGEHLLLVGNQGVGKNKIVDRFLYLLNRPREYIQLHRDTTVQTLTLQPTVKDGVIMFEDSPLVRAVKEGHVLVVDEADKAPTHVTCILKTLVESGEMHLADGRRIVSINSGIKPSENVIVEHPDFRMIVLANRPGFPFLGNDFFGAMGDIFSCHAIDNPDKESEMSMLRRYGPNVPESTLSKLVDAFGELRNMADQGLIAYPYSTREVVNIVKHLEKYPTEGLTAVVKNVFDFDAYSKEVKETIIQTMQKHGIPFGSTEAVVNLSKVFPIPKFDLKGTWKITHQDGRKKTSLLQLPVTTYDIDVKGPVEIATQQLVLERHETRSSVFTEQEAYWTLPMHQTNIVADVAVTKATNRTPGKENVDIIHVATANPVSVYSLNPKFSTLSYLDLYDIFPSTSGTYRPRVKIAALAPPLDHSLLLHEEITNIVLLVNFESGEVSRLQSPALPETGPDKRRFPATMIQKSNPYRMCPSTRPDARGSLIFYEQNGDLLVALTGAFAHSLQLPCKIKQVNQADINQWIVSETDSEKKFLVRMNEDNSFTLHSIDETNIISAVSEIASLPLSDNLLKKTINKEISSPNRIMVTPDSYATVLVGFPDLETSEVYSAPRDPLKESTSDDGDQRFGFVGKPTHKPRTSITCLPESGQIIRALPTWQVPEKVYPGGKRPRNLSGYLEVTDAPNQKLRYVPVPEAERSSPYTSWMYSISDSSIFMAPMSNDGLVTVDVGGSVRLWETSILSLERSLGEWKNMIGYEDGKPLQVTYDRKSGRKADGPKHGKVDPNNEPHVGGNTWAGGTGGSNTAGLGGFGGPYRLDSGQPKVYQVPQSEKDSVPEEVRQAAREMAQKAFKNRLNEINMSEYDAEVYNGFAEHVRSQVKSLRVVLDSLQAKGKERQWLKNQAYGDLDDTKLIEGITGEKSIYKRRGEKEPELGTPQEKPKRIRLLVDVSGSMYRFNGYDGRLEREMEATLMMMEALENYEEKFQYDILGHSGEDHKVELVKKDKLPKNNKDRLIVLQTMHAHSQFCLSGDNTLPATRHAIDSLATEDADEHFVIILSDANFDRYGISPRKFGEILKSNDKVNAYAIFIGSLEDQAVQLIKQLPMGHAFVCLDTKNLPQILQQIFTSTMLQSR